MIFLTEQLLNDNKELQNLIDDEIALNQASLRSQKALKLLLLEYMQKLATSTTIVEPSNSSKILKILVSFKSSLEHSKTNIINLENLLCLFDDIKTQDPCAILSNIDVFNSTIIDINEEIFKNNSEILKTLKLTLDNSLKILISTTKTSSTDNTSAIEENAVLELTQNTIDIVSTPDVIDIEETKKDINNALSADISNETEKENISNEITYTEENTNNEQQTSLPSEEEFQKKEIIENTNKEVQEKVEINQEEQKTTIQEKINFENTTFYHHDNEKDPKKVDNLKQQIQENIKEPITIKENTLIISEKTKKVFLPYDCGSLEDVFKNKPDEYSSVEDIIRKDFIVPLDSYKIPSISRFRESYKLMRLKENKSFKEAFDLAFELFFNYNLHPAIISACRNLDELDIYLDYLSDNETHKFSCFDIVFEVTPSTTSKHSLIIPKKETNF